MIRIVLLLVVLGGLTFTNAKLVSSLAASVFG